MKKVILLLITTVACVTANAQKLPNKQEVSLKAPANVKIDGKATEWGDFKAYNSAIEVYYTIANDDKNLYLVIKVTDGVAIRKIIAGSITFSVSAAGGDAVKGGTTVTYPLFDRKAMPAINLRNRAAIIARTAAVDSFVLASNKEFVKNAKQIKLTGIKAIGDTLISIYNEEGIMAAGSFDNPLAYTYELALPLKYLNKLVAKGGVLSYNIKLNGSAYAEGVFFEQINGGTRMSSPDKPSAGNPWPAMIDMQMIAAPGDVSGTYTLAL
nr:hypothetical protein [uncultured Mucilaginibacter sp.]